VSREYRGGPQGLFDATRILTKQLVRELLAKSSGTLTLKISEEGATIKLDGAIVGVSPLKTLSVPGGVHTLAVEKEGFVVSTLDVDVEEKKDKVVEVPMLPSEEFKRQYVRHATTVRIAAWVTTGVGVAAIGTAVGLFVVGQNQAVSLRKDVASYNATVAKPQSTFDALGQRRSSLATLDALTLGVGIAGLVVTGVGVTLFATGDSPSHFDTKVSVGAREPAPGFRVVLYPLPTGLGCAGAF